MRCPRCQHENPLGSNFCLGCGARLSLQCASCGSDLPTGSRFCNKCGHAVGDQVDSDRRFSSPDTYTPKHLAEKILTSKSALEGERKQVTVLFADLKGSMELLADRDPEEARKLLDPVLERMMEAVHRYEGTVNQVMGDGIMALFGAPVAHEDHAVRACYAALDMQAALRRYAEEIRRTHGVDVQVRVGLNSGEVVVRAIGSDLRMDYSAVGQTTHLAARMEQLARPGVTLLTADTLRLAEGYVEIKPLGPVPLKGLADLIEVYELAGLGLVRSRLGAAAARGLTRFVGRDAELEQLRQALGRADAGHGQLVAVVGEPGVGKSRLVWEVTHSHRTHGWLIVQASSVSYGKATPYLPVIDLLKGYLKVQEQDDPRAVREKVTGKLLTLDEALKPTVPAFLALLDVPVDDAAWTALDPPQRRQRTLEAVKRLLLCESQVQPLLVVVEDLHWIDSETQAVLDSLVDSLPMARMLLLVNYRPEYAHRWGSKTYYTQIRLDPLPPESAEALLDALLGSDPALRPLTHLLIERTEGNPFFLEESVRTLVETKALAGERGAYRVVRALPGIQVPATVQAVLAARIDRLAVEEKRLLQAAAVIGTDVPFTVLQSIAEVPEDVLRHSLATLQASEFLHEARLFPDLEYTFKHALTHEVAYDSLLQERRRAIHARIVEAIERLYADRLVEHVDRLAHHASRGEVWEKTLAYGRQAGARAYAHTANREALAYWEQALAALAHLPEHRETIEQAIDLRCDIRNALQLLGELGRILEYLRVAKALAEALGDQRRLGQVSSYLAAHLSVTGHLDGAIEASRSNLDIARALEDWALEIHANYRLGMCHNAVGDYRLAMGFLKRTLEALEGNLAGARLGSTAPFSAFSSNWLVICLAELGEFGEAFGIAQEALRLAEALDHPPSLVLASRGIGYLHLRKGEPQEAVPALEHGLLLCRAVDVPLWLPSAASELGYAYTLSGRVAEALPLLEHAVERGDVMGLMVHKSQRVTWLSEAYLRAGRLDDALWLAESARDLARAHKERGTEAWSLRLLGDIASSRNPRKVETAEGHYRAALALATELGMRPLVAHCHLGFGKLYRRTGDGAKAEEHLATSKAMYREMDMGFYLAQADAAGAGGDP
jgi:class 3 adenylate cyclase/tetratricopeptide (TPR) repeat protein